MLDRTIAPDIHAPEFFPFPAYESRTLSNGTPLHLLPISGSEFTDITISTRAGDIFQQKKLQASRTCGLLKGTTTKRKAIEIAEMLDYYGAVVKCIPGLINTTVTLSALTKQTNRLLPEVGDMLRHPAYKEKEFNIKNNIALQRFIRNKQEVCYLSGMQLRRMLVGKEHPLCSSVEEEDYRKLCVDDLKTYHLKQYTAANRALFVAGNINEEVIKALDNEFGQEERVTANEAPAVIPPLQPADEHTAFTPKEGCLQSSVSIGIKTIAQHTAEGFGDYPVLSILNTLLGGYFGSRLMSNIREKKGYTYGIYSALTAYPDFSLLTIEAQTAIQHTRPLIAETMKEIERLKQEPVGQNELDMVRRYLQGSYLQTVSQGLGLQDNFRQKTLRGIDCTSYYRCMWDALLAITPEMIMDTARKYLITDQFYTAVAGQME